MIHGMVFYCRHVEPPAYAQSARRTEPAYADAKPNEADGEPSPRGRLGRNRAVGTRASPRCSGLGRNRRASGSASVSVGFRSLRVLSVVARFGFSLKAPRASPSFLSVALATSNLRPALRHSSPCPALLGLALGLIPPSPCPACSGLAPLLRIGFCCFGWLGVRSRLRLGVQLCKFVIVNYLRS